MYATDAWRGFTTATDRQRVEAINASHPAVLRKRNASVKKCQKNATSRKAQEKI